MSSASSRSRAASLLVASLAALGLLSCTDAQDAIGSAAPQSSAPTVIVPPRQTTTTAAPTTQATPSTRPGSSTTGPATSGPATSGPSVVAPSTPGGSSATTSTLAGGGIGTGTTTTTRSGSGSGSGGSGSGSGGGSGSGSGSGTTTTPTTAPPTTADSGLAQHERTRLGKQATGEERLVFDFTNRSPSAADVRYASGPVTSSSGATVDVSGDNVLLVTLSDATGAGTYVGNGYLSPDTMLQWGFTTVVEAVRVSDSNGELVWAIGVRGRPRFVTETYDARFVVQVLP